MRFVIKRSTAPKTKGQFFFHIIAANNKIIAESETYKEKRSAVRTINTIKLNAASARLQDKALFPEQALIEGLD